MKNSVTRELSSDDYHQLNQQRNTNHRERKVWENEGKYKKVRERQNVRERERQWMEDLYSITIFLHKNTFVLIELVIYYKDCLIA